MANIILSTIFIIVLIIYDTNIVSSTTSTGTVFDDGIYKVATTNVVTTDASKPPEPLFVAYPSVAGNAKFGVVLLLHGYMLRNTFYSQLMQHISSHGFIVVAPQLYEWAGSDATNDIKTAASITAWLADGLPKVLPPTLTADVTSKFAVAGHSRGGKAAFALALGIAASSSLPVSALIGIDPVDGTRMGQTSPAVLSRNGGATFSFPNSLPVVVIGSGLDGFLRTCTPRGLGHADFYRESESPASYFLVKDYGHLDMLDDDTGGMKGWMSHFMCRSASSREPMRRFVGGVSVAFLNAFLEKNNTDLKAIKEGRLQPIDKVNFDQDFRLSMTMMSMSEAM